MSDVEWSHGIAECMRCRMELFVPVIRLRTLVIGLYDDERFPGRCIAMTSAHHDDYMSLSREEVVESHEDLRTLTAAIRTATGAPRVNYAVLGNAESHVHWHVVPRFPSTERYPQKSPWNDPRPLTPLEPSRRTNLVEAIRVACAASDAAARAMPV